MAMHFWWIKDYTSPYTIAMVNFWWQWNCLSEVFRFVMLLKSENDLQSVDLPPSVPQSSLWQLSVYFQLWRAAPSLVWTMIRVTQLGNGPCCCPAKCRVSNSLRWEAAQLTNGRGAIFKVEFHLPSKTFLYKYWPILGPNCLFYLFPHPIFRQTEPIEEYGFGDTLLLRPLWW